MARKFENKNKDAEEWFASGGYKQYKEDLASANKMMGGNGSPTLSSVPQKSQSDSNNTGGGTNNSSSYYLSLLAQQQARAEQLAAQRQAAAQAAYDKNMAALNNAYAQRGDLLKKNYDDTLAQLQGQYDYGAQQVNQNADRAQQQAYINYMMSKRDLPQQLSAMGLTGGASESRLAGLYNSYGNARNEVDTGRNSDLASLLQTLNQNKSTALQNYNSALSDDEARKLAYQMELEQNLANQTADILIDKYNTLGELDSAYASQMAALQKKQSDAAAKAANSEYSASNEQSEISTGGGYDPGNDPAVAAMLQKARNTYASMIRTGSSDSEALDAAIGIIYDESAAADLSAMDMLSLGERFRGMVR